MYFTQIWGQHTTREKEVKKRKEKSRSTLDMRDLDSIYIKLQDRYNSPCFTCEKVKLFFLHAVTLSLFLKLRDAYFQSVITAVNFFKMDSENSPDSFVRGVPGDMVPI